MKKKLCLMCMSMMFLFAGCGEIAEVAVTISEDPYGPLVAASIVYYEAIETLIVLRSRGVFSNQEVDDIGEILIQIDNVFGAWHEAIDSGVLEIDYEDAINKGIACLKEYILEGKSRSIA